MLSWLVSSSLRARVLVLAIAAALAAYGIHAARTAAHDVFPEFALPTVEVQTEGPGLSSEEIERLITMQIEHALNGTPGLKTLRSKSVLGLSSVQLLFAPGTDLYRARQLVAERLAGAAVQLPAAASAPVMLQPLSSMSRAMKIGLWSKTLTLTQLSDLARWTIRPRLMAIRGVANVAIWGQRDPTLLVLVDPDRLAANGVALAVVERTAHDAVAVDGGGFIDTPNQRLAVRHAPAILGPQDLAGVPLPSKDPASRNPANKNLRLGDVADVVVGHLPAIGDAVVGGGDYLGQGILLIVEKHLDGNTLDVSRAVEAAMDALRPALHGCEFDTTIFRPATFIERALRNLSHALLLGCALVALVLIAFLFDWRTAVISMTAIPLSLLGAAVVLHLLGGTVNTMILAGLVIALGEVVDDAIIDVENIARRLRLERSVANPRSAFSVVLAASLEVRSAVVFASLIVVLVFVPVFCMPGIGGTFFRPLAFAYVLAIVASLLVALTVTPALCLMLLPRAPAKRRDAPLAAVLKAVYRRMLPAFVARPGLVVTLLVLAFAATGVATQRLRESLFPEFRETDFVMHWVEKPGIGLDASRRITERAGRELRAVPGVRNFGAHIGRAEVADEIVGPNFTELWISIDDDVDYEATIARLREVVNGYPGLYRDLFTYLTERMEEVLTGTHGDLVVRIFGGDLARLRDSAQRVAAAIQDVKGVRDAKVEPQVLVPQVEVRLRPEAAEQFGVTQSVLRHDCATLFGGSKVGELYEGDRIVDVAVWGTPQTRQDLAALRALPIEVPGGGLVPLSDLADVEVVAAQNVIRREGASRRIDVSVFVDPSADLGEIAPEVERRVRGLEFAQGDHPEFLGEYRARQETRDRLLLLAAAALAGILVLLHVDFQSMRPTLLVFSTLPFALIGGVAGAFVGGGTISLGSLVGFVTVLGIAARNGIMLVSHYRNLERQECVPFGRELVLRGAEERLTPILMTALCAGLALLPLAIRGDVPGQEIEYPMALVILGGLVTSTLLNLLVLPALYLRFGRSAEGASG